VLLISKSHKCKQGSNYVSNIYNSFKGVEEFKKKGQAVTQRRKSNNIKTRLEKFLQKNERSYWRLNTMSKL